MRPKKVILLIDQNEDRRSMLKFTLCTHAYKVEAFATPAEGIARFPDQDPDLIMVSHTPTPDEMPAFQRFKHIWPHVPLLHLAADKERLPCLPLMADATMYRPHGNAELLDRTKVLCARKRGPRKGIARLEPAVV